METITAVHGDVYTVQYSSLMSIGIEMSRVQVLNRAVSERNYSFGFTIRLQF